MKKAKKVGTMGAKLEKTEIVTAVKTAFGHEKKKQSEETTSREDTKKFIMFLSEFHDNLTAIESVSTVDESKTTAKVSLSSVLKKSEKLS